MIYLRSANNRVAIKGHWEQFHRTASARPGACLHCTKLQEFHVCSSESSESYSHFILSLPPFIFLQNERVK